MGLSWQQGPLSTGAIGRVLVPEPLPKRLLYVEPLRRRMRVRFGGTWIAESEHVLLLFEPGRYPVAYFPENDISPGVLQRTEHTTQHADLGATSWYGVRAGEHSAPRGAWQHLQLPGHARPLEARVAFAWRAMDAWFEEDEEVFVHPHDPYTRIDILHSSRHVEVEANGVKIADTHRPTLLFETRLPTRYYIPKLDVRMDLLTPTDTVTGCAYKGFAEYWSVDAGGETFKDLAWSYKTPLPENVKIAGLVAFYNERADFTVDGERQVRPKTKFS